MAIKLINIFNQECKTLSKNNIKLYEPNLVKALIKALNNNPSVKTAFYHQKKVMFNYKRSKCKKELCDILIVIKYKKEFRFSFVQNKSMINDYRYQGLGNFKIDRGQHTILTTFPIVYINGVKSNILKNHKYKTITTYSVFYKNNNIIDFDLSAAVETDARRYKTIASHNYTTLTKQSDEFVAHANCHDIVKNCVFGEKVTLKSKTCYDLISIIKTFDIQKRDLIEFFNNDNILNEKAEIITNDDHPLLDVKGLLLINLDN